jgi:hypothetical protein
MQRNAYPYHGTILHESDVPGYSVTYRQHVVDPVRFSSRIKVSIEHGHANHLSDDWAATAYWYQTLPSPQAAILPVERRLPTRPAQPAGLEASPPSDEMADEVSRMREDYAARFRAYTDKLAQRARERAERSRAEAQANTAQAADIRRRFR